jgi:predicted hotdog family 3-hydroxylacyl-ACP dehydratase
MIPHAGSMCLLAEVCEADAASIRCRAVSHRDSANPLRDPTGLPSICGVEYAAQAMAVHGAIAGGGICAPGMLAAARDVVLHVPRLDVVAGDLFVVARRLVGDRRRLMYEFELHADATRLLHGRATVVLGA